MEGKVNKIPLIVISGPTASGKTAVSLELAKMLPIEIISADSRQVYKFLDIGTAKPSKKELSAAPHHFIDFLEPDQYYSSGRFGLESNIAAMEIYSKGKYPVVVGGSGLYIKALCEGFFDESEIKPDLTIRNKLINKYEDSGIDSLYDDLVEVDPDSAQKYSDKNPRRVIRALEYFYNTNEKFSAAQEKNNSERNYKVFYFGIQYDREKLYERINTRTDIMWENGLIEETEKVLSMGFSPGLNSLNTVGYKEVISYLDGIYSIEQAKEEMKKNTRRYAKRQLTWFRNYDSMIWLNGKSEDIAKEIFQIINKEIADKD